MNTPEEMQLTARANQETENNLSSVKIIHKVEMKSGKQFTEWEVKVYDKSPETACKISLDIEKRLQEKYGVEKIMSLLDKVDIRKGER